MSRLELMMQKYAALKAKEKAEASIFASKKYWDERYEGEEEEVNWKKEEWYFDYSKLKGHFSHLLSVESNILVVGCGLSLFSEELTDEGYNNVVNMDYSKAAVEKMRMVCANRYGRDEKTASQRYLEMDVTDMGAFADGSFDAVFDKGTLDTMCNISEVKVQAMLNEISRVLKPKGVYVIVTFGDESERSPVLLGSGLPWKVERVRTLSKGGLQDYFLFVVRKQE